MVEIGTMSFSAFLCLPNICTHMQQFQLSALMIHILIPGFATWLNNGSPKFPERIKVLDMDISILDPMSLHFMVLSVIKLSFLDGTVFSVTV